MRMIIIYTIIFVLIGLFLWLYIINRNKREADKITKDFDIDSESDDVDKNVSLDVKLHDALLVLPKIDAPIDLILLVKIFQQIIYI